MIRSVFSAAWLFFFGLTLFAPLMAPSMVYGQKAPKFATQKKNSKDCGPCCVLNALLLGAPSRRAAVERIKGGDLDKKVATLVETYGQRPSEAYGKESVRCRPTGVATIDLLHFAKDLNRDHHLPTVQGKYLNRNTDEPLSDHVRRIHKLLKTSIDAGVPVIVTFRSFAPKYSKEKEKFVWTGLHAHYVTIDEIQPKIDENEKGFRFRFANSSTGRFEYGYAYIDEARNFTARMGNMKDYEWLRNRPFLLVTAPSLRLKTNKTDWHLRTTITLSHAIYQAQATKSR